MFGNFKVTYIWVTQELPIMQKDVIKTWFFAQPPSEVWLYLTEPELIGLWLMACDFKPVAGHKFKFINGATTDAYCQVLEIVPQKLLSYSWCKGKSEEEPTVDSVVTWTLSEKSGGTELHLLHNGFASAEDAMAHNKGWDYCMNRMIELINTAANQPANA